MNAVTGIFFFCKEPRRRRRSVALPGSMARPLFPSWNAEVAFPARVCLPCLRERPELAVAEELPPPPPPASATVAVSGASRARAGKR